MEDGVFPPNTNMFYSSPDLISDMDLDELLLDGFWLGTNDDGSEFLNLSPTSNPPFDPSFIWPNLGDNNGESSGNLSMKDCRQERQISSLSENLSVSQQHSQNTAQTLCLGNSFHSENLLVEGSELSRKWWIGPRPNNDLAMSVMERLIQALEFFKGSTRERDFLLQIWVPVNRGGKRVLSTSGQPFSLDLNSPRLARYRDISMNYQFSVEEGPREFLGLPGRVFMGKVPEWTPDVRFFRREEYPRVDYAQKYDVRGTLAVPVFEQGNSSCLGVIEVVTTSQKINYKPELERVCKALEAFDLRGSEVARIQNVKICDGSYQAALPEILEVLRSACETNSLPLAQTWVSCVQQSKSGCRHSDENLIECVSTVDSACYVANSSIRGFHEACSEHHLLKGQGVVGRAFITNQPCFSADVTSFSKTEYPLSHHSRMFGLSAAVAIRLRSLYTGTADFVLEFFLPMDCKDPEEQKKLLNSLSVVIQNVCKSLRIVTDKELQEEAVLRVGETKVPSDRSSNTKHITEVEYSSRFSHDVSYETNIHIETQDDNSASPTRKPSEVLAENALDLKQHQQKSTSEGTVFFYNDYSNIGNGSSLNVGRTVDKRRIKAEKNITLEMLRQHFAGSLKDAARSIGVCPTTLKRICRQHGITRWPSRKIKKVGHSLQKIQGVIDSVQGASGGFQIKSFYSNFPDLASPNISRTHPFSDLKRRTSSNSLLRQNEDHVCNADAAASESRSSSCSQNSHSSQCCSTGTQPQPNTLNDAGHEDLAAVVRDNSSDFPLKRTRSEVELLASIDEVPKLLPRSQSHKSLIGPLDSKIFPTLPTDHKGNCLVGDGPHRVKVSYGEDMIRFRMLKTWGFQDLVVEILRRFGLDDKSGFYLKYLDDESEWMLLTCDEDFEECLDVYRLTQTQTIKLCLFQNPQQHLKT